jgi:hypothetical protein
MKEVNILPFAEVKEVHKYRVKMLLIYFSSLGGLKLREAFLKSILLSQQIIHEVM